MANIFVQQSACFVFKSVCMNMYMYMYVQCCLVFILFEGQKPLAIATPTEVDDGSLFNIRCKLFYKKEAEFVELGVGNLRVTNGEKGGVCLLLRNDTAMKKVLLNVLLSKGIPLSLQKNTILLVCQPNPPLEVQAGGDKPSEESDGSQSEKPNKPITYLLKVKEEQKAKELHSIIKDNL